MTGMLLTAGPLATLRLVRDTSRKLLLTVTKAKFETAAKRLESANLGRLVVLGGQGPKGAAFIKMSPAEITPYLQIPENADLCTLEEYEARFHLPSPPSITEKIKRQVAILGTWVGVKEEQQEDQQEMMPSQ